MTFLDDQDLAQRYGVCDASIWRWVRRGQFPQPIRLTPGTVRWRLSDVEAFEEARAAEQTAARTTPSDAPPRLGSRPRGRPRKAPLTDEAMSNVLSDALAGLSGEGA